MLPFGCRSLFFSPVFQRGLNILQRNATNRSFSAGISRISRLAKTNSRCLPIARQMQQTQDFNVIQSRHNHEQSNRTLVYEGPLSKPVKYVKTFSLSTALASLVGSPILVYFGKQSVPLVGKLAIAGLLCLVGSSTTVILHWFTKAYVHKMYFDPVQRMFFVHTLSFFGRVQRTEFSVEDVIFPEEESAFSTFQAQGKWYFIHQEMVEAQQVLHFLKGPRE